MRRRLPALTAALVVIGSLTAAADETPVPTPFGPNKEAVRALGDVRHKYGADAALLEAYLLGHAIQAGSVLEASIAVAGIEEHEQHRYLTYKLETGIVYNDHELAADARLGRTWTRIIERSLRMFRAISIPADGVAFVVTYTHKPYADEADLRAHLSESHGEAEGAAFYVLGRDIDDLAAARIDGQQLADRAIVQLNGEARRVQIEAPTPTVPPEPTP